MPRDPAGEEVVVNTSAANQAHLQRLARGIHAWIGAGGDSNSGAVETPHGLLVIDSQQHLELAHRFREALRSQIDQPLRMLVNTHYHFDHIGGNTLFAEEIPIVAHENTRRKLKALMDTRSEGSNAVTDLPTIAALFYGENIQELVRQSDPAWQWIVRRFSRPGFQKLLLQPPSNTFADRLTVHLPHDRVEMVYHGPAHSAGDVTVHVVNQKVIFLGDLFFQGRVPWIGDCDLDGWIAVLDGILRMDLAIVVPGHGVPTTLKELAAFRDLLKSLRDAVAAAISAGRSEDAAVQEVRLPEYIHLQRYDEWMPFNIRSAYRYLRGGRVP
jgi:cyclase